MGAAVLGERLQHEAEGRGNHQRRPERLQDAESGQDAGRGSDRAEARRHGEHDQAREEDPPAPDQVGDPTGGDQERGEDDVVGIQDPGER